MHTTFFIEPGIAIKFRAMRCIPKLSPHCSGGHPACGRVEASCPADHAHALERSLLVSSVAPGGKMHALCGRQDARRYRQLRDACDEPFAFRLAWERFWTEV